MPQRRAVSAEQPPGGVDQCRLSIRRVLQAAPEAEVGTFLRRERYQRDPDARPGYRDGHQPVTVKATVGPVTPERPKLRGTDRAFPSRRPPLPLTTDGAAGLVVGRLPGERSCPSLARAVLDRAGRTRRGANQAPANARLLQRLRHQLPGGGRPAAPAQLASCAPTAKAAA
jgi:hypothetical protein